MSTASPSSIPSDVFSLLALLSICGLVLLAIRYYLPLRSTPAFLLIPVFLALALPTSIVLLVPIDLASTPSADDGTLDPRGVWLPERVRTVSWRISYWLTFGLTWIILPLLGEYVDSGYRTPKDRFLYSLRQNGRYQLTVVACCLTGLMYVLIQNGFHMASLKALVMALSYCWGLVLAIYLMGHGLVVVPRRLYRNASISGRLRRLQSRAPQVHDNLIDSISQLADLERQVDELCRRKHSLSPELSDWVEELCEYNFALESRVPANFDHVERTTIPAVITEAYLADLTRSLKRARHKRLRYIDAWDRLVQKAGQTQAIIDASSSRQLEFGRSTLQPPITSFISKIMTPSVRYHLHAHILPFSYLALSFVTCLASVCVVWSELVKSAFPRLSIVSLTVPRPIRFPSQVTTSLWLFYMCYCTLSSIPLVPVWGDRALVRRRTYGESACWYSAQVAKLTVPLAYNYLTFLPRNIHHNTTFYNFLGQYINLTPLGKGFDYFFPILIMVPVCAATFNLYGRIKRVLGFGILDDDANTEARSDEDDLALFAAWREGKDLIDRELNAHHTNGHLGLSTPPPGRSAAYASPSWSPSVSSHHGSPTAQIAESTSQRLSAALERSAIPSSERGGRTVARNRYDSEDEEEGFFQGLAHRVRNTVETAPRLRWFGNDNNTRQGLGRWFGREGRVRI